VGSVRGVTSTQMTRIAKARPRRFGLNSWRTPNDGLMYLENRILLDIDCLHYAPEFKVGAHWVSRKAAIHMSRHCFASILN